MRPSSREIADQRRLETLANSILWGRVHFNPRSELSISSDGRAYVVNNLWYAASLLEAVSERRAVDVNDSRAIARANTIIKKLLARIRADGTVPRFLSSQAPKLPYALVKNQVLPVLLFFDSRHGQLNLSRTNSDSIRRALLAILKRIGEFPDARHTARRARRTAATRTIGASELELLNRFKAKLPKKYHWSQSIQSLELLQEQKVDFPWPVPLPTQCGPLEDCKEIPCSVADYIPTRFFKGDWKPPHGRMLPVVFVGGWQPFAAGVGGAGFICEEWWSTLPPTHSPNSEGNNTSPPPIDELRVDVSSKHDFAGLALTLMRAGYDLVRFSQSQPGDDIQIAVNELSLVIDKTKELYQVDKVILVCHSRGGLIARKYIIDRWEKLHLIDVEKLITYGTAHLGAQLAEIGVELITHIVLSSIPLIGPIVTEWLDLIGLIPSVGPDIKSEIQDRIFGLLADLAEPLWEELAEFLESGEQLRPSSNFISDLNQAYNDPVVPMEDRMVSLWAAIDHVLIAGTSPSFFKIFLGSWVREFDSFTILDTLAPRIGTRRRKIFDHVYGYTPYIYWEWDWTWHPILDLMGDLPALLPILAPVLAFQEGKGDSIVEKTSALAEGAAGKIRRAQFKLHHFNLKANDEQYIQWQFPSNQWTKVNPLTLLLVELGVPIDRKTACRIFHSCGS